MLDPSVTHPGLAAASEGIAALAADHATRSEADRRLAPEVVQAVLDGGFARWFVPAAHGGDAGRATFAELLDAVATIGRACASTAWYASLTASLGRMAAFLPDDGQQALWASGPDPLIVGALMPLGRAEAAPGGWRLRGAWPFVSAIDYSDWALVCGMASTDDGPEARFFAVPRAAYRVEDTWFNVGMRATGSNTLVLDEAFVPATHSFNRDDLARGLAPGSAARCHTVPLRAANGMAFAAPALGAADGALASWTAFVAEKQAGPGPAGLSGAGGPSPYEVTLARASAEVDAARMFLGRAATVADAGEATPFLVARNTRDCAMAVDLAVAAVDRLFRTAGTSGQAATNALQRFWRDVNVAATHVVVRFEPAAAAYAAQVLRP